MVLKTSYTTRMSTANFDLFSWQFLLLVLILCDVIQTLHNIMFSNRMYPMSVGKSQESMKNMSCVIPILLWYDFYMLILSCLFFFWRKSGSKFPNDMNDQIEIIPWKLPHKFLAQIGNSGQRAAFRKCHCYIPPSVLMLFKWWAIVRGINYFFDPGCVVVEITIIRDTSPPPKQILSGHVGVVWNYSGQCFIHVVTDSFSCCLTKVLMESDIFNIVP